MFVTLDAAGRSLQLALTVVCPSVAGQSTGVWGSFPATSAPATAAAASSTPASTPASILWVLIRPLSAYMHSAVAVHHLAAPTKLKTRKARARYPRKAVAEFSEHPCSGAWIGSGSFLGIR